MTVAVDGKEGVRKCSSLAWRVSKVESTTSQTQNLLFLSFAFNALQLLVPFHSYIIHIIGRL